MVVSFESPESDLQTRLKARIWREWLLTTFALLTLTFNLSYFNDALGLRRLDNTLYDHLTSTLVQHPPSTDIVIVAIDDSSIRELGYWPWRRAIHAVLLDRLSDARAVALDLLLSEQNPAYPEDDAVLADAIRTHGRVVLPLMVAPDDVTLIRPLPVLADAAQRLGYINIHPDPDGVIRSFSAQKRLTDGRTLNHLSLELLETGGETDAARQFRERGLTPQRIAYSGFPGVFSIVPYNRALDGSLAASTFKDKYVLIGSWGSGLGDTFATPYSHSDDAMSGVEVLANLLNGAMTNQWISTPGRLAMALLGLIPVLIVCIAFRHMSPQRAFLFTTVLFVVIIMIIAAALHYAFWWLSPAAALIGIALAYPVWSWRSQHAALAHIDDEMALLHEEHLFPQGSDAGKGKGLASAQARPRYDATLLTRIGQLHHAIDAIRIAQRQRNQTLRFLSHDMRAPLNSILALTELERSNNNSNREHNADAETDTHARTLAQFDHYAHKTLELVDGFVALGRAESIDLKLRPTNLSELILQCCDDAWVHARKKQIKINTDALPPEAWINADADLLARAWTNLLDNALKYSPEGTTITCSLERDGRDWVAVLQDRGRGMDPESLASVFVPFVRFAEQTPANPSGVGLGLAFVQTVVGRHGGRIKVQSQPDAGTRFSLWLGALDTTTEN